MASPPADDDDAHDALERSLFGTLDLPAAASDDLDPVALSVDLPYIPEEGAFELSLADHAHVALAQLLFEIWNEQRSGELTLTAPGWTTHLYFKNGATVGAESSELSSSIGALLVHLGRISEAELSAAIHLMTERLVSDEALRLGEVLVSMGLIGNEDIVRTLELQLDQRLMACFRHRAMSLRFRPGVIEDSSGGLAAPIPRLVSNALREHLSEVDLLAMLERFREARPTVDAARLQRVLPELNLSPAEQATVASIRQARSIGGFAVAALAGDATPLFVAAVLVVSDVLSFSDTLPLEGPVGASISLARDAVRARMLTPARLLRVGPGASIAEVEAAAATYLLYDRARRTRELSPATDRLALEVLLAVDRARQQLRQQATATDWLEAVPVVTGPAPAAPPPRPSPEASRASNKARAESSFTMGKTAMERTPGAAIPLFRKAVELDPESREYAMFLANAELYAADDAKAARLIPRAHEATNRLLEQQPNHAKARVFLGRIMKRLDKPAEAQKQFQLALDKSPNDADAKLELRLLEKRAETKKAEADKKKKKGLFG